jgi:hypothetical protein
MGRRAAFGTNGERTAKFAAVRVLEISGVVLASFQKLEVA